MKFNQGGYDFVQWIRNSKLLRVIQATRAQTHDYKLKYVAELIKNHNKKHQFEIKVLDIVPKAANTPKLNRLTLQH